jgi:hypothetical protein
MNHGDAERSQFPILLGDECSPDRGPSITLIPEEIDGFLDLPHRHAIHGFSCSPLGHRAGVSVDPPVCPQVEVRIVESSLDVPQVFPFLATIPDDGQRRFGVLHVAYLHDSRHLIT